MNNANPFQVFQDLRESIDELTRAIDSFNDSSVWGGNLADQIGWLAKGLEDLNNANKSKEKTK